MTSSDSFRYFIDSSLSFIFVRYRGLAKNATRAFTTLALANIYLAGRHLMAQLRP